jgi:preprotein translocase subunit Sss1
MSEEWQFDIANNPQAINKQDHYRNVEALRGEGASTAGESVSAEPELSAAEWQAYLANVRGAEARERVRALRQELYRLCRVDKGLDILESYRSLRQIEAVILRKIQSGGATSMDQDMIDYICAHRLPPEEYANDWFSRQGNRWCVRTEKAAEKEQRKRDKAKAKLAAKQVSTATGKPKRVTSSQSQTSGEGWVTFLLLTLFYFGVIGAVGWLIYLWLFA